MNKDKRTRAVLSIFSYEELQDMLMRLTLVDDFEAHREFLTEELKTQASHTSDGDISHTSDADTLALMNQHKIEFTDHLLLEVEIEKGLYSKLLKECGPKYCDSETYDIMIDLWDKFREEKKREYDKIDIHADQE